MSSVYTYQEVIEDSEKYFNGDKMAAGSFADKYALNNEGKWYEKNPDDMFRGRIVPEFVRIENKYINPLNFNDIFEQMDHFYKIVPQGSPLYGIGNFLKLISIGNCYVVSPPKDSWGSIMKSDQELAQIMKRRGGAGIDISSIRPRGFSVNNAAKTTDGIEVFMDQYSDTTKRVAQAGGRRGALMVSILCTHIQILDFIKIKRNKNRVTGANISVKFTEDFFDCLKNKKKFVLRHPATATIEEAERTVEIDPQLIWDEFIESNHMSAEPGALFWDNLINNSISDCYADVGFATKSTNPCFAENTEIMTRIGDLKIKDLVGKDVVVFDGENWVSCNNFRVTGENQDLIRFTFDDKSYIDSTPYHNWILNNGDVVSTKDIIVGDRVKNLNKNNGLSIVKIENIEGKHTVYCCTIPTTSSITLANGCVTRQCGELPLPAYGSCILLLINLLSYVKNPFTKEAYFDFNEFKRSIEIATRLGDDMVDIEIEKITKIIEKVISDPEDDDEKQIELNLWKNVLKSLEDGRRVGLGITALADMLAYLNIKYDSDEALNKCDEIFKFFHQNNFYYNSVLAKERGSFKCWDWEKEKNNVHIKMLPQDIQDHIKQYGRRNISVTTIAPAGTISIQTQTSSGGEPVFEAKYTRRKKISPEDDKKGVKPESVDSDGTKWTSYQVVHRGVEKFIEITGKTYEESPYYKADAKSIDWKFRVKIQGLIQKYITHSISSTLNLPENITKEEMSEIYLLAHDSGCKGITTYRDKCREGVLISWNVSKKTALIYDNHAPRRPKELPCEIYHSNVLSKVSGQTEKWIFFVGLLEGRPYEVFGGKKENVEIAKKIDKGWIVKNGKNSQGFSTYDLYLGTLEDSEDRVIIKDIASQFKPEEGTVTRMTSLSLRHGAPVHIVVQQLGKDMNSQMFAIEKCIARILKRHIKDGIEASSSDTCPSCKSKLVYKDGCITCSRENDMMCSWSKCS